MDTYSEFQREITLSSLKANSAISHLLEVIAIVEILVQSKTDNFPT